jgi:hypothetical protein
MEVSGQLQAPPFIRKEGAPRGHGVGQISGLDVFGGKKNLLALLGI